MIYNVDNIVWIDGSEEQLEALRQQAVEEKILIKLNQIGTLTETLETIRLAKENGYVCTGFGRRRVINEIKSPNFVVRSFGERAAMNQAVFRYYSNAEETILSEIAKLDIQINEAIGSSEFTLGTTNTDISSLEREIELVINDMHKINNLQKINICNTFVRKKC